MPDKDILELDIFTIFARIKCSDLSGLNSIFSTFYYQTQNHYWGYILRLNNGIIQFANLDGDGWESDHMVSSPSSINQDQYYNICVTYDGSKGAIYVDGEFIIERDGMVGP